MHDATVSDTATTEITPVTHGSLIPPSLKVAAMASLAGLRDSRGDFPLYASVPVRAGNFVPTHATAPAARVLLEVDGSLSLREIASKLDLPLATAIEAYFDLMSAGIIRATTMMTPEAELAELAELEELEELDEEGEDCETGVSDIVDAYAQLSAATGTPTLRGAVEWSDLSAHEAWAVSVVSAGFDIRAILDTSPLGEEKTMTLLGELVASRIIAVRP